MVSPCFVGVQAAFWVSDGLKVVHEVFFDTVAVDFGSKEKADKAFQTALELGYNLRRVSDTQIAAAFHETSVREDLAVLYYAFTGNNTFTLSDDVKGRLKTAASVLQQVWLPDKTPPLLSIRPSRKAKRRLKPFSDDVLTILLPYNRVAAKAHK